MQIDFKIGQVIRPTKYIFCKPYNNEQFYIGENLGQADYKHYSITSLLELYPLFCFQLYREALDAQIWIQSSFSLDAILREEIPQLIPCQNLLLPKLRWKQKQVYKKYRNAINLQIRVRFNPTNLFINNDAEMFNRFHNSIFGTCI